MRFGAWVVEGELGRGGMGVVYAAVHSESGERRALKVIHAPVGADEEVARFSREVRVCMALRHPHVVRVVGVERTGPENGALPTQAEPCCLILELCEGGSLAGPVRRDGPLPARQALELFDGVLAGLGHVHQEHGFVHRDIKPDNILLAFGSDGRTTAKLADFGLAKAYDSAGLSELTHTGAVDGPDALSSRPKATSSSPPKTVTAPPNCASGAWIATRSNPSSPP